jgi:hypothetical protein
MAKQTFTTGQVLTAAQMTSLQQTAMLGGAANAKVASYVLVAADAGDAITMSNASPTTITVNTGLFAAGDIVTIINLGAGACTITAGTATVDTSGSLVLATNQGGVLRFTSASAAIFFQFATPASGDIEGVTAGTGISGGGTSGTVTITNSMATAIDAKGDLVVGTGADTFSRLAVGTNGHTLVADSAETTGLKWAAPASGALTLITGQSFSASSSVLVNDCFSSTYTNYKVIVNYTGSASAATRLRFRVSGSSNSNNSYDGNSVFINNTTIVNEQNGANTSFVFNFCNVTSTPTAFVNIEIGSPNESKHTAYYSNGNMSKSGAVNSSPMITGGSFLETTVFTGFELFPASGNITGSVQVYGYGK